jgi:polysaccharide biosynthesis protein PslG
MGSGTVVAAVLAGAAIAVVALTGCGESGDGRDEADPGGDENARIELPPRRRLFGLSTAAFTWTDHDPALDIGATPERSAAEAVAMGANSVRVPYSWWQAEPQQGRPDSEYIALMDRFVRALERRGGRVLFFLGGAPPWASTRPGDPGGVPRADRYALFARFAAFVADRYPRAVGIETWNEPNAIFAWKPAPDPAAYTKMHQAAARAIRATRPAMKVVLGGLAGTTEDGPQVTTPERFLEGMYAAGLRPADYDALALHPYPAQRGGRMEDLSGGEFAEMINAFRRAYRRRDQDAEMWITETGLTTSGPDAISPEAQADGLLPLVRKLLTMPRVKAVFVHTEYDLTTRPQADRERGFGLLRSGGDGAGKPKPAFCALRRLVASPPAFRGC